MEGTDIERGVESAADETAAPVARVDELVRELRGAREALRDAENRSGIIRALAGAGAVDIDTAAPLVERMLPASEGAADIGAIRSAIDELRRQRPAMFRTGGGSRAATMGARIERATKPTVMEVAAAEAVRNGDRVSLLHYLRLKRRA